MTETASERTYKGRLIVIEADEAVLVIFLFIFKQESYCPVYTENLAQQGAESTLIYLHLLSQAHIHSTIPVVSDQTPPRKNDKFSKSQIQ